MKSSRPESAHWRSSKTSTVVPLAAILSKKRRHAGKSVSRPPAGAGSTPSRVRSAGSIRSRSAASGTCWSSVAAIFSRVVASSSSSARPARRRIISPSAQNVIPSPYEGDRPRCHQMLSVTPSTYFSSSQTSRLLPIPAGPVIETSRTRCSRPTAWSCSFSCRSSSSRPTNGASSASARPWPPACRDHAQRLPGGDRRGLALQRVVADPLEHDGARRGAHGGLSHQHGAGFRHALEPRGGVDEVARHHSLVLRAQA